MLRKRTWTAITVLACTLWGTPAPALLVVEAGRETLDPESGPVPLGRAVQSDTADRVGTGIAGHSPFIDSSVSAIARYGTLRVVTVNDANNPGNGSHNTVSTQALAHFDDRIIITAPGVPTGTLGSATFDFDFHGGLGARDGGVSDISRFRAVGTLSLEVLLSGVTAGVADSAYNAAYAAAPGLPNESARRLIVFPSINQVGKPIYRSATQGGDGFRIDETLSATFNFAFGSPVNVRATLTSSGFATAIQVGDEVSLTANALNTASWGGLRDVTLSDATPVTDFTALGTAENTDYRGAITAVPLPAALWLLLVSLPLLGRRITRDDRNRYATEDASGIADS